MPPSPRSLLWPTILMPRKLYFSVRREEEGARHQVWKRFHTSVFGYGRNKTGHSLPMLSVTVMMLRLIVESVMLLKDEDWRGDGEITLSTAQRPYHPAVSARVAAARLTGTHPVYFGHFVPPSAAFVSAHELWRRTLFSGAAEPETEDNNDMEIFLS